MFGLSLDKNIEFVWKYEKERYFCYQSSSCFQIVSHIRIAWRYEKTGYFIDYYSDLFIHMYQFGFKPSSLYLFDNESRHIFGWHCISWIIHFVLISWFTLFQPCAIFVMKIHLKVRQYNWCPNRKLIFNA